MSPVDKDCGYQYKEELWVEQGTWSESQSADCLTVGGCLISLIRLEIAMWWEYDFNRIAAFPCLPCSLILNLHCIFVGLVPFLVLYIPHRTPYLRSRSSYTRSFRSKRTIYSVQSLSTSDDTSTSLIAKTSITQHGPQYIFEDNTRSVPLVEPRDTSIAVLSSLAHHTTNSSA